MALAEQGAKSVLGCWTQDGVKVVRPGNRARMARPRASVQDLLWTLPWLQQGHLPRDVQQCMHALFWMDPTQHHACATRWLLESPTRWYPLWRLLQRLTHFKTVSELSTHSEIQWEPPCWLLPTVHKVVHGKSWSRVSGNNQRKIFEKAKTNICAQCKYWKNSAENGNEHEVHAIRYEG